MKPIKFICKQFKDDRGHLTEITPKKIKKKFIYSILTESKKMLFEECILIKKWMKKSQFLF